MGAPSPREAGETRGAAVEERGETAPLLLLQEQKASSGRREHCAAKLADCGELISLPHRSSDWRGPAIILGFKVLEGIGYAAVQSNLVIYLSSVFHETNAASAANTSTWEGTTFFAPLLGAIVADTFLGSYRTVLISTLVYLLGMITVTLSAFLPSLRPPPCEGNLCPRPTTAQTLVFFHGLYLVALGCGAAMSPLLPLGADQFYDEDPADREKKASFFSSYYLCITLGGLVANSVIVWVQVNVSWELGYGLGTLCLALALGGLLVGTPILRLVRPGGSPLKGIAQVLVASFRKMHLDVPSDSSLLYEVTKDEDPAGGTQQLSHTESLRFLDKAATVSDWDGSVNGFCRNRWRLCTVTQVEELKMLLRLLPIWISCVIYRANFQMRITFIQQGNAMNKRIGSFSVPPASLQAFEVLCVTCLAVSYDKILAPAAASCTGNRRGLPLLHRIGLGHALVIIATAVAAVLEAKRLEGARVGKLLSIAWQLPSYFILACSETFGAIGQMQLFYDQAPDSMKSMCSSFFLLTLSMGSYLSSLVISFIMFLTTRGGQQGWLPDDLNEGHLDYVFWIWSALSTLNLAFYAICAKNYSLKKAAAGSEEICS